MKNFEIIARAAIFNKGKILVCQKKKDDFYFLPGGHADFGEISRATLGRELKEELGITVKKSVYIGATENIFIQKHEKHHEINLVFYVVPEKIKIQSKESHIDFKLITVKEFSRSRVLPIALKKSLLKWFKDKKIFWATQINSRKN